MLILVIYIFDRYTSNRIVTMITHVTAALPGHYKLVECCKISASGGGWVVVAGSGAGGGGWRRWWCWQTQH